MNIPTCNDEAIEQFRDWLQRARDGEILEPPVHLITGDAEGYSLLEFDEKSVISSKMGCSRILQLTAGCQLG